MAKELARQVEIVDNDSGNVMPIKLVPSTGNIPYNDRGNHAWFAVMPFVYWHYDNTFRAMFASGSLSSTVTANGTGSIIAARSLWCTLQVVRTAGTTNVVDVRLEGSLDGSNWYQLAQITDVSSGSNVAFSADKLSFHLRYNVVDVGTGNTLKVMVGCTAAISV